ncbi:hypothetical protein K3495_g1293 [Podosphaera aphanis]|nr:hypothetical protein K3495_g1293 [Podosphaera aphanis]
MSSNSTVYGHGNCPTPFLPADLFPASNGFVDGRVCSAIFGIDCCLPCPRGDWLYSGRFEAILERIEWINIPSLLCSVFLIASFAFLPVSKTRRHYLSLCLVISVAMMSIGFLIPLGAKPAQCDDPITPNGMKSNTACAISGGLVIAGGWFGVMWVCLITLALHLQICWHVDVGTSFMCGALIAGWLIPTVGMALTLSLSGVSFRFGNTCHVNAQNSLGSLWIPLMVVAGFTLGMQLAIFIYCLKVYFASLGDDSAPSNISTTRSYIKSRRVLTPKEAYHRIQRVIQLQWRGILIVLIIVTDVIFFAVVFVSQDKLESTFAHGTDTIMQWIACLIASGGNKEMCLTVAKTLRVSEAIVISVLVLLSLNGFWCLLLLGRFSMLTGWWEMITGKSENDTEFVSADVHAYKDPADYEMLASVKDHNNCPETSIALPKPALYDSCGRSARSNLPQPSDPEMSQPGWNKISRDLIRSPAALA